jgi:hypothetical protein
MKTFVIYNVHRVKVRRHVGSQPVSAYQEFGQQLVAATARLAQLFGAEPAGCYVVDGGFQGIAIETGFSLDEYLLSGNEVDAWNALADWCASAPKDWEMIRK